MRPGAMGLGYRRAVLFVFKCNTSNAGALGRPSQPKAVTTSKTGGLEICKVFIY